MTFYPRGFLVFAIFAAALMVADARAGILAVIAWGVVEALFWSGLFGFGRGHDKKRS